MKTPGDNKSETRASRNAIERIYINMRHLFIRGSYKPTGISGRALMDSLLTLSPEIYGLMNHSEKVELEGILYVLERLPDGIAECRFITLTAREGIEEAGYEVLIPSKRRRNCYRIDKNRMYVEMTRGRSDIYDILTHLTFLYHESEKIKGRCIDSNGNLTDVWKKLEEIVEMEERGEDYDTKRALVYLSNILGRTVHETGEFVHKFEASKVRNSPYHVVYWLSKIAIWEHLYQEDREVLFSAKLRDIVGQHVYGEQWANQVKAMLIQKKLADRPIHIVSANLHSFLNILYGFNLSTHSFQTIEQLSIETSKEENKELGMEIKNAALANGMYELEDNTGTNLTVQIFDMTKINFDNSPLNVNASDAVIVVMDYAFGEQAYECMDELLKPLEQGDEPRYLNVKSVTVMGKAGILTGEKGDIMIPTAHIFEGTADNYPFENQLKATDFDGSGIDVYEGTMVTVLGTSLQNKNVLNHFLTSTWNSIGLEMEGAHYQKAIQSAAMIRASISKDVKVLYAYYASDNPLKTGNTLASGSLGIEGVKPTYLITRKVLEKIMAIT